MVAKALSEMGVDTIEAGFAASSPGEFEAVRAVSRAVEGATVAVLSRCCKADIEISRKALELAKKGRLHLFLATSPIHREHKLRMDAKEVIRRAVEAVSLGGSISMRSSSRRKMRRGRRKSTWPKFWSG